MSKGTEKKIARLARIEEYVKDKTRLFKNGESERSKAITEILTNLKYIIDDKI